MYERKSKEGLSISTHSLEDVSLVWSFWISNAFITIDLEGMKSKRVQCVIYFTHKLIRDHLIFILYHKNTATCTWFFASSNTALNDNIFLHTTTKVII